MLTLYFIVGDINCPVTKVKWTEPQSNRDALIVILLSIKNCTSTNGYSFWPSGKHPYHWF